MKKTERMKRRYVLFRLEKPVPDFKKQLYKEAIVCFGEEEYSKTGFTLLEFYPEKNMGIARCERKAVLKVRDFLNNKKLKTKTVKTSGTIRKLKEIVSTS
ncbi:hypothetical protein JXB01_04455 [Candidatus Micrarchaeota archaeon]|nr:hypothetical protein [Candidatus Micrarchaeota archaeon]